MKQFLEAGEIINTHGIRGELKVRSFCDKPQDFLSFQTLYLDGEPVSVRAARVHKGFVLLLLDKIDTIEKAERLKNRMLYVNRDDVALEEGAAFLQDIIGFSVFDERTNKTIGTVSDILSLPAGDLLEVRGDGTYLIPMVPEFFKKADVAQNLVVVRTIEGMLNEI